MKELKIDATHDNPEGDGKRINPLTCEFGGIVHLVPTSNPEISNGDLGTNSNSFTDAQSVPWWLKLIDEIVFNLVLLGSG
jgi:hypothetical protein